MYAEFAAEIADRWLVSRIISESWGVKVRPMGASTECLASAVQEAGAVLLREGGVILTVRFPRVSEDALAEHLEGVLDHAHAAEGFAVFFYRRTTCSQRTTSLRRLRLPSPVYVPYVGNSTRHFDACIF